MKKKITITELIIVIVFIVLAVNIFRYIKSVPPSEPYIFEVQWGSKGDGNGQFNAPMGIDVDKDGNAYITDVKNNCIQKFNSKGKFLLKYGSKGEEDGQFKWPKDIAIDIDNNVYVADTANGLQKFDSQGDFIRKWGCDCYGGISINCNGKVYVASLDRLKIFDNKNLLDEWVWNLIFSVNQDITNITIDNNENIYIVGAPGVSASEREKSDSIIYKCDKYGNFEKVWGDIDENYKPFGPVDIYMVDNLLKTGFIGGITTDLDGNVLVADTYYHKIDIYSSKGKFIISFGTEGSDESQFNKPASLAVDNEGNLYIVDTGNYRVQKFAPNPAYKEHN